MIDLNLRLDWCSIDTGAHGIDVSKGIRLVLASVENSVELADLITPFGQLGWYWN